MKKIVLLFLVLIGFTNVMRGQTYYNMTSADYSENFSDITNWTNNFAAGIGAAYWGAVATNSTGTIPDGVKITNATSTFVTGSSAGVQRGSGNIVLLTTGSTDNTSSCAIDLRLNFTGRLAGKISFDWAEVNNSTGNRAGSLRIYTSIDGTSYTELTGAQVLNFVNNVSSSGSISSISLPSNFNDCSTARVRFYYHNGSGGTTGSRPKISIDNISITSTPNGIVVPTLSTTAISSITFNSASSGGNISANGGEALTSSGVCWNTTTNPVSTDSHTSDGTSLGSFSSSITGLNSETYYYVRAYATNNTAGAGYGNLLSFWTLSPEPSAHSTSFSNSVISQVQINLAFDAASTISNADGYIILQKVGSAPTGTPTDGNAYAVGNAIGDGTVAAITNNSATLVNITGLSAGTTYYFTLIPFNYNSANNETYNYKTDGTIPGTNGTTKAPLDATSEVSGPALGTQPNPVTISSLVVGDGSAVRVFDMDVHDDGTSDGEPTKITQITIKAGTNNTANWVNTIAGVKLSTDGGIHFVTIGTPVISASSIVIPITSDNLNIRDADVVTLSLYVYLKSSGLTDNQILEFKVDATASSHGFVADGTGSTFLETFASAPVSNQILIDVVATKLQYIQQPSNTSINTVMTPAVTIEAVDANNNRDLDKTGTVTLASTGTMTEPVTAVLTSGFGTFGNIIHTALGTGLTVTATLGLLSKESNTFDITNGLELVIENFNYADNALLTSNGWVVNSSGSNSMDVGASNGLTYNGYSGLTGITGVVTGNAARLDNTGEDLGKLFITSPITSGNIFFSFLVNVSNGPAGYFLNLGGSTSAFAARIFVKPSTNSGFINFGISNTSTATYATTPTDFNVNATYIIIVKYEVSTTGTCSLWVKSSGIPETEALAGTPEVTAAGTGQSSIDRICLRQYDATQNITIDGIRVGIIWGNAPLPVELVSFTANNMNNSVVLNWQTATEINNQCFEIERNIDGNNWVTVGSVVGHGNSNVVRDYSFVDTKLQGNGNYEYRLKQIDNDGNFEYFNTVEVVVGNPDQFELSQNYPNPFNPSTTIKFTMPNAGNAKIIVYNTLGQQVAVLIDGYFEAGFHSAQFNASQLSSGIYFYKLETANFTNVKKMILTK